MLEERRKRELGLVEAVAINAVVTLKGNEILVVEIGNGNVLGTEEAIVEAHQLLKENAPLLIREGLDRDRPLGFAAVPVVTRHCVRVEGRLHPGSFRCKLREIVTVALRRPLNRHDLIHETRGKEEALG